MHYLRRQRLMWVIVIALLLGAAFALALYALRQNIDLFFTPQQVFAGQAPYHHPIRVGGWVVNHSVQHRKDSLAVRFVITDHHKDLLIEYDGILPDLFREGQAVVVDGELVNSNQLLATEVLAKHDENYIPPQVAEMK